MKNTITVLTILSSLVIISCQKQQTSVDDIISSGDLDAIRGKRSELNALHQETEQDIEKLDAAIEANTDGKKLPLVTTFKAQSGLFDHYVELQGDVATRQNILIYPEVSGQLVTVLVKEGQKVSKGQKLGVIDDGGLKSQLEQLEVQLELSKTTFERQERLWNDNIGTEIQYLQAKTGYYSQKSAVDQLKSQLVKFTVRAPFTGVIDDIIQEEGTIVAPLGPGSEIFRLINLADMYLEVDVPEVYIPSIVKGKAVDVYFPILDLNLKSSVRQTGNFIKPDNRSYTVEISVPNKGQKIKPNMTARVSINDYSNEEAILVPQDVISENAIGEQYVFVAKRNGKKGIGIASKQIVEAGKTQGDMVEITKGIEAGQDIIKEGARSVKDGQEVKILSE